MPPRVAILTSRDLRHRYFVNAVADRFDVVAVGYQDTGYVPADTGADRLDDATGRVLREHFDERSRQERAFFGHNAEPLESAGGCVVRTIDTQSLNTTETADMLGGQSPDVVLVYGTSIIKAPLLDRFAGRMINMHLGLSPYYRGTATNFYPLVNEEPEYVGATIHLIDPGIDSGPIIRHARPDITADDMPHTVGCKAILAGLDAVLRTLGEFGAGRLESVPQWAVERPRLYLRKDYHSNQVVRLYERITDGLFPKYVERMHTVRGAFRLIS